MEINLQKLNYSFNMRPLLFAGKAMEFYGLRKSGADIDFIVTPQDFQRLVRRYPNHIKQIDGDLGICTGEFEFWQSVYRFDYHFLCQDATVHDGFMVVSLEKLLFLKALSMREPKCFKDLELIVERIKLIQQGEDCLETLRYSMQRSYGRIFE